jgi:glutamyl-tRNA synthetase
MNSQPVVTRFAPSPTGYLHIGGARTALFNWLYAKHTGGKFLLRIEDTDRARSTQDAIDAIFAGLKWLGLDWDNEPVFQSRNADRHRQAAEQLLAAGKAYHCYTTPEELTALREEQKAKGLPTRYDGRWRNRDPKDAPPGIKPVVRLKAAQDGETVLQDLVQGEVRVANSQLDDMILLRSDGTPTYMLSVVVDDIDMKITHVVRGDDHLTNAFRQLQLFEALGATPPAFGHIPLIHGPDGAKLSKRHGALGVEAYRDMGFLPEAMRNYLARLGWSHGDDELFSDAQAISWFDVADINRSPARLDLTKLSSVNAHYIKETSPSRLIELIAPALEKTIGGSLTDASVARLMQGMAGLKPRAKTLVELAEISAFYVRQRPIPIDAQARKILTEGGAKTLADLIPQLGSHTDWTAAALEAWARTAAEAQGQKLGQVAQPLRAALVGAVASPPLFEAMEILGAPECLGRLQDAITA